MFIKQVLQEFDFDKAQEDARAIVQSVFEQLKVPELDKITVIEFNQRFTNKAGDADLQKICAWSGIPGTDHKDKYKSKIRLGMKYFSVASEKDREETCVHEACHIVDKYLFYTNNYWRDNVYSVTEYRKTKGHGSSWGRLMFQLGYKPNRYHCTNTSQFKTYFMYDCVCGKQYKLTAQRAGRMKNWTSTYCCTQCKSILNPAKLRKVDGASLVYG